MTEVSVLMPAYRATRTIERAIDSALAQTLGDLEVIVADDCSTDGTADLVRRRYAGDDRVRVIELPKNGGPSAARNAAMKVARGEWFALLDADDAWRPDRLEVMLRGQGDCDMIADQILGYDDAEGVETGPFMRRCETGDVDLVRMLETGFGFDFGFLQPTMRRSFLERHGLVYAEDMRYGEDLAFYLRALACGARFRVLPYAGYVYTTPRGRQSGVASSHSHTRPDKIAVAERLEAIAAEFAATLSPRERSAFAWRAEFYRSRIRFDHFVDAARGRDAGGVLSSLLSAPWSVGRHLVPELWMRFAGRHHSGASA